MKVCGIVAEYNPFHNGHQFHIAQTKQAGATHVVIVLSGNFVQRAEPALLSKFERAKLAVLGGADLVLELPVQYAVGSSERFALGAVSILHALGCVDMLSFGSESGDLAALEIARQYVCEPAIQARIRALYEQGDNYPVARQQAVAERYGVRAARILSSPNNLLGIDYLKALCTLKSPIVPMTIPREAVAHDSDLAAGSFASAGLIRSAVKAGDDSSAYVPATTAKMIETLRRKQALSGGLESIERAVLYRLRGISRAAFCNLPDCADGLGNRLYNAAAAAGNLNELYETAKTRRYTMSRVHRAVVCAMLDIDNTFYFAPPYARILAIGTNGGELLERAAKSASIPISHSLITLRANGESCEKTANAEIRATDLFNLTLARVAPTAQDLTEKLYTRGVHERKL